MFNLDLTTRTERAIVGTLIFAAIQRGYAVSVNDGVEWTVSKSTDEAEITSALATTGYDTLKFRKGADHAGSVFLVWGNDEDVIADHTDNDAMTELVAIAIKEGDRIAKINTEAEKGQQHDAR